MRNGIRYITLFVLFIWIISCQNKKLDYFPTEGWQTATPESQGIDSQQLLQAMRPLVTDPTVNLHSMIIIRNGYIIAEYYSPLHNKNTLHNLYSATKSFTSTLIGTAVTQKKLDLEYKVLWFFPDQEFDNVNNLKKEISVRNLLMMGSGIDWNEWFIEGMKGDAMLTLMFNSQDWNKFILDRKVFSKPGFLFNYNSGNSHLLSTILSKISDQSVSDYAEKNLFNPLGISDYIWTEDSAGVPVGGFGLQLSPRDMAKLGLLYLNDGVWDGKRLLSKKWIKEATSNYYPKGDISYGYQLWINDSGYCAWGEGGQLIDVLPEENTIIVTTGAFDYPLREKGNKEWEYFRIKAINAKKSDSSIPGNPKGYDTLIHTLQKLSVEKKIVTEAPASIKYLIGKTINLDANQANLTSFTIVKLDGQEVEIEIKAIDPADETEKAAIYRAGLDHRYIDNGYQGYPLSAPFHNPFLIKGHYPDTKALPLFMRGTFPDDKSLTLESMIPGSVVHSKITLKINDEGPLVIWRNIGRSLNVKIRGNVE